MVMLKLQAQARKLIMTKVMYVSWKICTQSNLHNSIRNCLFPGQGGQLTVFPSVIQGPKHGGASMCLPGNTKASGSSSEAHHDQGSVYVTWKICTQSNLNNNTRDCSCPGRGCWRTVLTFLSLIEGPKLGGASIRSHRDVEASCVRNQDHHDQGNT